MVDVDEKFSPGGKIGASTSASSQQTNTMDADLALLQDRIDLHIRECHDAECRHVEAIVHQQSSLQEHSERELLLWKALYKLNDNAVIRGKDLIAAQATALANNICETASASVTGLWASSVLVYNQGLEAEIAARKSGLEVEACMNRTEDQLNRVMTLHAAQQSATHDLGVQAEKCQRNVHSLQMEMRSKLQGQSDATLSGLHLHMQMFNQP